MEERELFFPLFIDIKNKKILVVGAGKIAYRKVQTLLKYGADITIITKEIKENKFKEMKNINIITGDFSENMLENIFMVVAATDNPHVNKNIYEICNKKNILVNNITSKTEMNCRFGAVIDTEEYTIGISAKGDPEKAKKIREKFLLTLESF